MSKIAVTIDNRTFHVELDAQNPAEVGWSLCVDGERVEVIVPQVHASQAPDSHFSGRSSEESGDVEMDWLVIGDRPYEIMVDPDLQWIHSQGRTYQVGVRDIEAARTQLPRSDGRVKAPIPGQITRVLVEAGQHVDAGGTLFILEAMKMENHILAPFSGVVRSLDAAVGQSVLLNQVLAEITKGSE